MWDVCAVKKRGAVTDLAWWQGKCGSPIHTHVTPNSHWDRVSWTETVVQLLSTMNYSMPGFPALHYLLELVMDTSCPLSQWCYLTILSSVALFSFCLESFPASGSFPMNRLFESDARSIGVSTSASVLPMDIQGWVPLGLTGLISLQSKGLASIFSNTTVQKHQFLALSLLYGTTLTSILDHWKNHNFDYTNLYRQSDVSLIQKLAPILTWY